MWLQAAVLCCAATVCSSLPCASVRLRVAASNNDTGDWSAALRDLKVRVEHIAVGAEDTGSWQAAAAASSNCDQLPWQEGSGEGSGDVMSGDGEAGSGGGTPGDPDWSFFDDEDVVFPSAA